MQVLFKTSSLLINVIFSEKNSKENVLRVNDTWWDIVYVYVKWF